MGFQAGGWKKLMGGIIGIIELLANISKVGRL